jgi:hypothetical protein
MKMRPSRCHDSSGTNHHVTWRYIERNGDLVQGDQKVSVHLMVTIQKVTSNVQSVARQSPDIY